MKKIRLFHGTGFYFGRFEAGKDSTGKLVCKKDVTVWSNISQSYAMNKAKELKSTGSVRSALVSGNQWDYVMGCVNGKPDGVGTPFDVTKNGGRSSATNGKTTGANKADKVYNIYDLEGNFQEYDTGITNYYNSGPEAIVRGGCHARSSFAASAYDFWFRADYQQSYSFRCILYVL